MQQTAPGSTFKMITAFAAMNEGAIGINDVIQTKGYFDKNRNTCKMLDLSISTWDNRYIQGNRRIL